MKHTILFLAANPLGTDRLGVDREARGIQAELERTGFRDSFVLETRWAAEPLDLLRELRKLRPTVVHFSGHGRLAGGVAQGGLVFQGLDGGPQVVLAEALEEAFDAAGASVKLVVLNACYSEPQAEALLTRIDCVVGMRGSIRDDAARSFAIGFYGGLGERESVAAAYKQGCAAISLEGLRDADRPQLRARPGVNAARLVLASARPARDPFVTPASTPKPAGLIDFSAERARHARFVGRADLLVRLDRELLEKPSQRWIVVTGGPGMGKSAVLAAWLARRETTGDPVPHHFIRRGWANWDDPEAIASSLVAQLEVRVPDAPEPEADARLGPAARLAAALQRMSERVLVPRGERLVVLIDGLDEYDPRSGSPPGDPLATFLPYTLPPRVSVLCASRPRHPYVDSLATRGVLIPIDLDDASGFAEDNTATVRALWDQAGPELGLDARFVVQAVERAAGNPQHAEMLRRHLTGLLPEQCRVEDIPDGLSGLLTRTWERIRVDPGVVAGLGVLCAAREGLTLDELEAVTGWTGEAQRDAFHRSAREILLETRRTDTVRQYRLHHDSIRAYIIKAVGEATIQRHHRALAERLATWPAPSDATARRYALRYALLHRVEASAWADAWRVAADVGFLEAKCRESGVHDVEADVVRTADQCRTSGDEVHGARLTELARALGRESHWLRTAPEAITALVWNRLCQYGWTASDLDAQLRVPATADFLRVRHVATRESSALVRTLAGHTRRVLACAVTGDGRHVVSASLDGTLKVWELASGRAVATLAGHTGGVRACAVTGDGRHVVSASEDWVGMWCRGRRTGR